jgi:NADH-quinone oxidoreductase subunit G
MQQQDLVSLTIDGREVSVPRGTTVLHAAEKLGIEIPTFCYSKKMEPLGACRMCLVSIEKAKGFPPSCATAVAPGMVVHTVTPDVVKTQQGMLEFLLINHPLDCPICDKGGECPLQNQTFKYGPGKSRYAEEKRHFVKHLPIGPQIVLDRERCIVCQLCVRFMDHIADDPQIVLMSRGGKTEVNVFPDRPFDSPFAGNTIELCPVGALTSRKYRFKARPWDLQHTPSICATCAVGCNVTLDTRRNALLRLVSRENLDVDDGWLCDYGRFSTLDRLQEGDRLTTPLVRRDGELQEASWNEALQAAASGLMRASHTGVAALAGAQSTNEELYLLGRLFRTQLRSADIGMVGGSPAPTAALGGATIADMETADLLILVDADPVARQHVLDLRIKKQVKRRQVPLLVVANAPTKLDYLASAVLPFDAADPAATLRDLTALVSGQAPTATGALAPVAALLQKARRGLVVYDERLVAGTTGPAIVEALLALARAVGQGEGAAGKPLALAAAANSRGAAEMGAHGGLLPGGVAAGDATMLAKLAKSWGLQPMSTLGRPTAEIINAASTGLVRGMFLLQYDPAAGGDPAAIGALEQAGFVVLQASRASAAMAYADVVLPATDYAETTGTLTNTEGRVQRLQRSITPPEEVREGWEILADLGTALDGVYAYRSAEDITREIADLTGLPAWTAFRQQALEPAASGSAR